MSEALKYYNFIQHCNKTSDVGVIHWHKHCGIFVSEDDGKVEEKMYGVELKSKFSTAE